MKKRKWILPLVIILLAAAVIVMGIYFYPAWRAAETLFGNRDSTCLTYELDIELDEEKLDADQVKVIDILAGLTGLGTESLYRFTVRGSVWEDIVHILVYPEGRSDPLIELYVNNDTCVINEAMFVNSIRNHIVEQNTILGYLLPVQENSVYMSMEQTEQLLGLDFGGIRAFEYPFAGTELTAGQYFAMLALMKREKTDDGEAFLMAGDGGEVRLEVPGSENSAGVRIRFSVQDPAEIPSRAEEFLTGIGVQLPAGQPQMLKRISGRLAFGEGSEIVMPTDYIDQDIIDLLSGIRELIQRLK